MTHQQKQRRLGVAPLCAIEATPREYLQAAKSAGFDFVGVRLFPVTEADIRYTPGGREFAELRRVVADSGLQVLDTEVFRMSATTTPSDWMPILEMGAQLGATLFNVVGADPDMSRFSDNVARLSADARRIGIMPVLEPIAYLPLDSYEQAIEIAQLAGCAVELDGLHALRTGLDPRLVTKHPDLFPIFQLCDAPRELPQWGHERPARARPQDNDMMIESRLNRILPGQGDAPLADLLAVLPDDVPIAMEIPNLDLQSEYDSVAYLQLLHREAVAFLR